MSVKQPTIRFCAYHKDTHMLRMLAGDLCVIPRYYMVMKVPSCVEISCTHYGLLKLKATSSCEVQLADIANYDHFFRPNVV